MTDAASAPQSDQPDEPTGTAPYIARFGSTVIRSLPPVHAKPGDPLPATSTRIRVLARVEEPTTPILRSAPQFYAACRQIFEHAPTCRSECMRRRAADREAQDLEKQCKRLLDERSKLLQAHYAGAIPLDLMKDEQDRIADQLARIEVRLESSLLRH